MEQGKKADRVHPLVDVRRKNQIPPLLDAVVTGYPLRDTRDRALHDLRISVTDRCNFRCVYCMPKSVFTPDYQYLQQSELLSFEEITRLARIFVALGVRKIRLTGGEPLLRRNVESLIALLADLRTPSGEPVELTLTTNGSLLSRKARALREAGLHRLTVSLDALDETIFRRMNDVAYSVEEVLSGIAAAEAAGFDDIKVNMVVKKGWNDSEIIPMARYFRATPHTVRFIEYMDVGASNGWKMDEVVPSQAVIAAISESVAPLKPRSSAYPGEVAQRWEYVDNGREVGVISSVTQAFCRDCTRARLSTEGQLYTCLFATEGHDIRALLRGESGADHPPPATDDDLRRAIASVWTRRTDRYSEIRTEHTSDRPRIEMSYIGG